MDEEEGLYLKDASTETENVSEPSKTYRVFNNRIAGYVSDLESVAQSIEKILSTERFSYPIYSDNYGVELESLIGQDYGLVEAEINRIVSEALLVDDRIIEVVNVTLEKTNQKDSAVLRFDVNTVYGQMNYESEVSL
nr:MAG TPA: Protein of unknown function (DUF2634) [Caudoviricetes sp.]